MLRTKLVKNGASDTGRISSVVAVACLILAWSRPSFSVEPTTIPEAIPEEQSNLQFAPIRWSSYTTGNIGYLYQRSSSALNTATSQSLGMGVLTGIEVQSFFWQPWLAQVGSHLSAGINSTSTNRSTTPTYNSVNTSIEGDAAVNLLKSSRFPFEARIYKSDGRYTAFYSGTNLDSQGSGYNLSQSYRSRNSRLTGNASFASSKLNGSDTSPSYADTFIFNLGIQPTQHQTISISGNTARQNAPDQGRSTLIDTLVANHAYQPNFIFSLGSFANTIKINQSLTQGSSPAQNDVNLLQFNSLASFRPEKTPLTMTSSVRFLKSDSSSNGILAPTLQSSNFNLGANYLFSKLIRLYGSVNVADSLGTQTVSSDAAVVAAKTYGDKTSIATDLGGFRYSGSIGGSLSTNNTSTTSTTNNQTVTNSALSLGLGVYLSHALNKDSEFGAGHLSKNLHQTVSMGVNSSGSSSISNLNTGGALSWNRAEGKEHTLLRLSANDSRSLDGTQNNFEMINLQASRSESMSRNESLRGSLTIQATHTQASGILNTPNTITPSAELNYHNLRTFKVRNLTFDSILRIADTNIAPESHNLATRSWDNNFIYRIGRLNLRLETRISKLGNNLQSLIRFNINRTF